MSRKRRTCLTYDKGRHHKQVPAGLLECREQLFNVEYTRGFSFACRLQKRKMLSNQQFDRTRRLALNLAGIELSERHRELFDRRSQRVGIGDSAGLDLLLAAAEKGEPSARRRLLGLLTTKFTGFFRHPVHFKIAAEHALRMTRQYGHSRLWSTAAATGEEPYSLAMGLIEVFGCEELTTAILATDIDADAMVFARRGEYGEVAVQA